MRRLALAICLLTSLALVGPGCQLTRETPARQAVKPVIPIVPRTEAATEEKLPDGFERRRTTYADGRRVTWILARFSPEAWSWRMVNDPANPKNVNAWRETLKTDLVINGSYFDENFQPSGFYSQPLTPFATDTRAWPTAEQQKEANGYTGLLVVRANHLYLSYLPAAPQARPADDALLTYPTLLADGQPLVKEDSQKYARRTVLAQDASNTVFVLTTESGAVSLYEAAQWLAAQPERFRIAVNLDGGPSTGLSYRIGDFRFDIPSASVPNIITATKNNQTKNAE